MASHTYDCQIEGDQRVEIRATSAERAAREYVRGCEFDAEAREAIGSHPLTVLVWVDGDDVPQFVRVAMRGGRLA